MLRYKLRLIQNRSFLLQSRGDVADKHPSALRHHAGGCLFMAKLSEMTIRKFQTILREDYGRELTLAEARVIAEGVVGYFDQQAKIWHKMQTEGSETPLTKQEASQSL